MARTKQRIKIHHEPTTHEILGCLTAMQTYSAILSENEPKKSYSEFLKWLLHVSFYINKEEKITIKKLASEFKSDAIKVTKWIHEIYEDILELNYDKPELFQRENIKVTLHMRHYDDSCTFFTSLPVVPREHETIRFDFVQAKVGIDHFWIKKVEHSIEDDNIETAIWLEGGFLNKYREYALDKALFQGWIHFMDVFHKLPFELDDELKKIYHN